MIITADGSQEPENAQDVPDVDSGAEGKIESWVNFIPNSSNQALF